MLHEGRFAAHAYPNLRLVLFAGEVFPGPRLASLQAVIPHARYANLYGPTESNVVTWYDVPHGFDGMQPPPIGRSCPYASVRVDPDSGELLAGGDSLMAGYWNRPEETRSSFARVEGTTYYRTGDRVSLNADGDLLFCGRMDRQVKRRGFRIELGEIEAALLRNENLLEAAVVAAEDTHQSVVIIAFLRSRAPGATSVAETRTFLSRRLPTYMLPDTIVFIPQMPKGNRGKIDYGDLRRIAQGMRRGHQD
jgi:acyl-coenzyme A synthetase/AMP-(fatty) acid ligase